MNYSFTLGNQAYLVQNPWSVDTNVSWHTTARKHMQQMFLLFRCYHKKSTSVVWHHRDTSQTKTRKVGQNVWASYEFPDLEYAESIPKKHSNEKRFSRMAEEVWDVGRCATSDEYQHWLDDMNTGQSTAGEFWDMLFGIWLWMDGNLTN